MINTSSLFHLLSVSLIWPHSWKKKKVYDKEVIPLNFLTPLASVWKLEQNPTNEISH